MGATSPAGKGGVKHELTEGATEGLQASGTPPVLWTSRRLAGMVRDWRSPTLDCLSAPGPPTFIRHRARESRETEEDGRSDHQPEAIERSRGCSSAGAGAARS